MACGCPVLVSDIPGNREWVQPGENGWLFPDGDAQALGQAIIQAVEQRETPARDGPVHARKIAEAARRLEIEFPPARARLRDRQKFAMPWNSVHDT